MLTRRKLGFTLVEIAIAVAVLAILSATVLAVIFVDRGRSRISESDETLTELARTLSEYRTGTAGQPVGPPPVFDIAGTGSGTGTAINITGPNVGTGANRCLIVGIVVTDVAAVSSVTWDQGGTNQVMTRVDSLADPGNFQLEMWRLVNPTSGARTLRVNFGASRQIAVSIASYTGCDQTTPVDVPAKATGNPGTTPTVNVSSIVGDLVVDVVANESATGDKTPGPGQTERAELGAVGHKVAASDKAGAPTVTMSWTPAFDDWAIIAVSMNGVGGGAPAPGRFPLLLSHLTNEITDVNTAGCPLCRNSCGSGASPPAQSLYSAGNVIGWRASGPFYPRDIPYTVGLRIPIGIVRDTLYRNPATAADANKSFARLAIRIDSVFLADAQELDLRMDGSATPTTGVVTWTAVPDADGMLSSIFWNLPIAGC